MAYTREQLAGFIKLGFSVLICGKSYTNIVDLPSDAEIEACYKKLPLNERDTFFGLSANLVEPKDKDIIIWHNDTKKWVLENLVEVIMETLTCSTAAQNLRNTTDSNTQLIDQACNLINQQQSEIDDVRKDLITLQSLKVQHEAEIIKLKQDLLDAQNKVDCDANTIALLENSIKRLGAANVKLEDCLRTIESVAEQVL